MGSGIPSSLFSMRWFAFRLACVFVGLLTCGGVEAADVSDEAIRDLIIRQSIATYPGNCPCPYNLDRAGRRCGARSAYSKPGGRAPLCYPGDVSDEMVAKYRKQ
jgi:hypothetical protein